MAYKLQKYTRRLNYYCVVNNAFTEEECDKIIDLEDLQKFQQGRVGSTNDNKQGSLNKKSRDSDIMWIHPSKDSDWLFQKFGAIVSAVNYDHFMYNIDGFDAFQYTVYKAKNKQHYNWHMDLDLTSANYVRKISASVMLTDPKDYEGGEFELVPHGVADQPLKFKPKRGEIIFFSSFMPHRVTPVTSGVRKSLVCWVMGERTH
jgi:PKHD-type hydroxylase